MTPSTLPLDLAGVKLNREMDTGDVCAPLVLRAESCGFAYSMNGAFVRRRMERGLIGKFMDLRSADDAKVFQFAKKWGALHLCPEHGLPYGHSAQCQAFPGGDEGRESCDDWRALAGYFYALLKLAISISEKGIGTEPDWNTAAQYSSRMLGLGASASPWWQFNHPATRKARVLLAREHFRMQITHLIGFGQITFQFRWDERSESFQIRPNVWLQSPNLFSLLVFQFLPIAANPEGTVGYAACKGCGQPYLPLRLPNPNRLHFCGSEECKLTCWKLAKRRERDLDRRTGRSYKPKADSPKGCTDPNTVGKTVGGFVGTVTPKAGKNRQTTAKAKIDATLTK